MPFYEYECPNCGYHDEVLQKITDKPLKKCPSCGKNGLKKLMSAPVFRLKGSGWYETDFKSDKENKRNLAGPDKEEAKSDEKKPDTKTDAAKPDKADTAKPSPVKGRASRKPAAKRKPARKARR
jgi:putative FmdB family regulatory protein